MRIKLFFIAVALSFSVQAMAATTNETVSHSILWLVIAIIAVVALVISIINAFRISQIRKVLDANAANTKEDMDLSFRKMKSALYRDVKNIRREINKQKEPVNQKSDQKHVNDTEEGDAEASVKKKNPKRRYYNRKKKPQGDSTDKKVEKTPNN